MSTYNQPPRRYTTPAAPDAHRGPGRTDDGPLFTQPAAPQPAPAPAAGKPPATFTVNAMLDGFPFTVAFTGTVEQLPATIDRLRSIGATPPAQKHEWNYTPEGLPICPKHGVPMKKREKQGDTWYSHVAIDDQGEELYCRGYHGKDSPGYEC